MTPMLLLSLGLVAVGVVGYLAWLSAKKRRELLAQFAASNGWTYVQRDDSWTERLSGDPFGDGNHRRADNVLQGPYRGRTMVAFDYSYQTQSTDGQGNTSSTTHRYAVAAVSLPDYVPKLELVPESRLGRIGTLLGMQDLELESEDFNRRYRVRTDNPKFGSDALPPRTMEALLGRPALHLRLSGADAVCWENGRHSPVELLARLDALAVLIDGIPEFVWTDLKGSAP